MDRARMSEIGGTLHEPARFGSSLRVSIVLALGLALFEVIGGILSNSLALLGDAGHVFADSTALIVSFLAVRVAARPHTNSLTYGFHRTEILATLLNGTLLIAVAAFLFIESVARLIAPRTIATPILLVVACTGLLANMYMAYLLNPLSKQSLNVRGAFLHVVADTMSSVGVIVGGVLIALTGLTLFDPIVSLLIGVVILRNGFLVCRDATRVLLEAVPANVELEQVAGAIKAIRGVVGVHDLHVWTITSGLNVLSGHLIVEDQRISQASEIMQRVQALLRQEFGIDHVTLQLEAERLVKMSEVT